MDQFILFGDSITQMSGSQERGFAFAAALQDAFIRRLDIVNRGLSGYNTNQALKVLPRIIPSPSQAKLRFFLVFFGANDARLPDTPGPGQTVSLEQFKTNLESIVTHPLLVEAHQGVRIILVTPPPIDEVLTMGDDRTKGYHIVSPRRTAENTAAYAQGVREVGKMLNLPVLDLWTRMMEFANWNPTGWEGLPGSRNDAWGNEPNPLLAELMIDGLHFKPRAYVILFEEVMKLIERVWPDQSPERLPSVLPAWNDESAWR